MYQPNSDAIGFCNWMLNLSRLKLTSPQRLIVEEIYNAALGNYPVSDQTWWNFNLFTAWRNKYYLVFRDYASFTSPTLLTDLRYTWNFEGNANSDFGSNNGVSTNITYSSGNGKIGEGAGFLPTVSQIAFVGIALPNPVTVNLWFRVDVPQAALTTLLTNFTASFYLGINAATQRIILHSLSDIDSGVTVVSGGWYMVSFTYNGSTIDLYVNGSLVGSVAQLSAPASVDRLSYADPTLPFEGAMDMFSVWDRILSAQEISDLWNGGSGLQYPF